MMAESLNSNSFSQTLGTLVRANGLRHNTKAHSTTTDAVNLSRPTCFRLSYTLFGDSVFVTALTIALVFGMIQPATSSFITSNYSGILSSSSPKFSRPNGNTGYTYYYQAIQVTVYTSGTYMFRSNSSIDAYGCFYNASFDPSYPSQSLITYDDDSGDNRQFRISCNLQSGSTYVLVVTTFSDDVTGSFSIRATGPASVGLTSITPSTSWPTAPSTSWPTTRSTSWPTATSTSWPTTRSTSWPTTRSTSWPIRTKNDTDKPTTSSVISSIYSGILTSSSSIFVRPSGSSVGYTCYYQAIQVTTYTSGTYTFTSISSMDTYGYFYNVSFDPSDPYQSLITYDDDRGGNQQFKISLNLQSGSRYILVVTTFSGGVTGSFSLNATGPASVGLTSITPSTTWSPTTSTTSPVISSTCSGALSSNSAMFSRPYGNTGYYYYQAIRVTIYTSGIYSFRSSSSMNIYGYLYDYSFDPTYPSQNLITYDDDSAGNQQFQIIRNQQYASTYVLVVTTYSNYVTGSFSIIAVGPVSVSMTLIMPATTTTSSVISSTFSGILSSNSPTFFRPNGNTGYYNYYQAIQVTIYTTGTYTFTSSSPMNTYGYFYNVPFDPSNPSQGLIMSNDDSGDSHQFGITLSLQSGHTYVLVVTTYDPGIIGSFSIRATGPASVGLTTITPAATDDTSKTLKIVGITFGSVILCVGIFGVYAYRQKRKKASNQNTISSRHNQSVQIQNVPLANIHRNATSANEIHAPCTTTMSTTAVRLEEELPPSYETFMSSLTLREQRNSTRF